MQRRFIAFRLREEADSDIIAAVQNITSNRTMSAICREGLRGVLNIKLDERGRDSIEMILSGRSIEEDNQPEISKPPITVKSKPAIFIPKRTEAVRDERNELLLMYKGYRRRNSTVANNHPLGSLQNASTCKRE